MEDERDENRFIFMRSKVRLGRNMKIDTEFLDFTSNEDSYIALDYVINLSLRFTTKQETQSVSKHTMKRFIQGLKEWHPSAYTIRYTKNRVISSYSCKK